MQPLTEQAIRLMLKKDGNLRSLMVAPGTLVTPSAAEYLKTRGISITYGDARETPAVATTGTTGRKEKPLDSPPPAVRFYGPDGGSFDHKPEALTHLQGNHLVYKDHPRIIWRGKLDRLTALIVEAQYLGVEKENQELVDELQEILEFVRRLLPCEYKNIPVEEFHLLGLSSQELRDRSHNPAQYYGHPHLLTDYRMGPLSIRLNLLRTEVREVECAAAAAFNGVGTPRRDDIIEALNRLSSLFYIMMYKYLPKGFTSGHAGI
jgi:ethanolamine utilization cobalamin adenosyltransferase